MGAAAVPPNLIVESPVVVAGHVDAPPAEAAEGEPSRLDRELVELLNEIRILVPGVQILFAFLLTAPFSPRFSEASSAERTAYFIAFASATLGSIVLIAPTAYHRVQFRQQDKERLLRLANGLCLAGLALIATGLASAAFFVTGLVYGDDQAWVAAIGVAVLALLAWAVLPMSGRWSQHRTDTRLGPRPARREPVIRRVLRAHGRARTSPLRRGGP